MSLPVPPSWTLHAQHVKPEATCHLCPATECTASPSYPIDIDLPDDDDARINTRIYGDSKSICFETTDHEGNDQGHSFELTWPEILAACKEYMNA